MSAVMIPEMMTTVVAKPSVSSSTLLQVGKCMKVYWACLTDIEMCG